MVKNVYNEKMNFSEIVLFAESKAVYKTVLLIATYRIVRRIKFENVRLSQ